MKMRTAVRTMLAAVLGLAPAAALGQTAGMVGFQGLIKDAGGVPISTSVNLTFEVFDAQAAGTSKAGPFVVNNVTPVNGVVSTSFGPVSASALDPNEERWLGVTVDGGPPMPRLVLNSTPASLISTSDLTNLGGASGAGRLHLKNAPAGVTTVAAEGNFGGGHGSLRVYDASGLARIELFGTSGNGARVICRAPDGVERIALIGSQDSVLRLRNAAGENTVVMFAENGLTQTRTLQIRDGGAVAVKVNENSLGAGAVSTHGPNGQINVLLSSPAAATANHGWIGVLGSTGNPANPAAAMWVNSAGNGAIVADVKNFRVPNPNQAGTDIWYACPEGPEAAAYVRGTGHLVEGTATIALPDHFVAVAGLKGMTVQLTPLSAESNGLAVVQKSLDGIVVRELRNGDGSYDFDFTIMAVRKGYENYRVIRSTDEARPALPSDPGVRAAAATAPTLSANAGVPPASRK